MVEEARKDIEKVKSEWQSQKENLDKEIEKLIKEIPLTKFRKKHPIYKKSSI